MVRSLSTTWTYAMHPNSLPCERSNYLPCKVLVGNNIVCFHNQTLNHNENSCEHCFHPIPIWHDLFTTMVVIGIVFNFNGSMVG